MATTAPPGSCGHHRKLFGGTGNGFWLLCWCRPEQSVPPDTQDRTQHWRPPPVPTSSPQKGTLLVVVELITWHWGQAPTGPARVVRADCRRWQCLTAVSFSQRWWHEHTANARPVRIGPSLILSLSLPVPDMRHSVYLTVLCGLRVCFAIRRCATA